MEAGAGDSENRNQAASSGGQEIRYIKHPEGVCLSSWVMQTGVPGTHTVILGVFNCGVRVTQSNVPDSYKVIIRQVDRNLHRVMLSSIFTEKLEAGVKGRESGGGIW